MRRIVIQVLPDDTDEKCLCGDTAVEIRIPVECCETGDYYDGDGEAFCFKCAKEADSIRPEDLI